jgi:hypothetical protein
MALGDTTAPSSGIWNAIKGSLGIFSGLNKAEGVSEDKNPIPESEYESKMTELEITQLISQWKRDYTPYYSDIEATQKLSFEYWIGKQRVDEPDMSGKTLGGFHPLVDNKIFAAVETFLPIATRANPDPQVQADESPAGQQLAHDLRAALSHEADRQKLRKKLKGMLRHWTIYRIGVIKISYNVILGEIETTVINPKRMVFDKDGHIDESGKFVGEYLGEKKQTTAKKMLELFPKKSLEIKLKCKNKLGTKLEYMEWWYHGTDVFYTMDDVVLGKFKNPHWNYQADENTEATNHFKKPTDPYIFLSIFSTGLQPHDETSLILQNIGLQDQINRRYRQIDKNVESMNNGLVVSSDFTTDQASQAASALRRGTAIRVPTQGNVNEKVARFPAAGIPADVFNMMKDSREELADIFGISGSTPNAVNQEDTARGKILINQLDASRIGGGITEYVEQVADTVYNGWVQLMFVHYDESHYITTAGIEGGQNIIELKNSRFLVVKTLNVTVKEGSLIPKDPLTQRNEAIDLWSANAIDPITLFKKLDFPDPNSAAKQLLTWQLVQKGVLPPQAYIPDFMSQGGTAGALPTQGVGGPPVNPLGPPEQPQAPAPASAPAVQEQGKQLLESVPIPK